MCFRLYRQDAVQPEAMMAKRKVPRKKAKPPVPARLQPDERGSRPCLKCEKPFDSGSAGNRICKKCTRKNDREYPPQISSSTVYSGDNAYPICAED